jgi:hypothetical protein
MTLQECSETWTLPAQSSSTATSSAVSASRGPARSWKCATNRETGSTTSGAAFRSCGSTPTPPQGWRHPRPRRRWADSSTSRAVSDNQRPSDIIRIAHDLDLDLEQLEKNLISAEVTGRVPDDMLDAEAVSITALQQRMP